MLCALKMFELVSHRVIPNKHKFQGRGARFILMVFVGIILHIFRDMLYHIPMYYTRYFPWVSRKVHWSRTSHKTRNRFRCCYCRARLRRATRVTPWWRHLTTTCWRRSWNSFTRFLQLPQLGLTGGWWMFQLATASMKSRRVSKPQEDWSLINVYWAWNISWCLFFKKEFSLCFFLCCKFLVF